MKANELMIGDWVHIAPSAKGRPEYDTQVYGIGPDVILVKKDSGANSIDLDRVIPIHLTPEILEKNGWEIYRASDKEVMYQTLHLENLVLEFYWFEHRLTITPYHSELWVKLHPIWDIHELQHALRLCGLDDLANNFTI